MTHTTRSRRSCPSPAVMACVLALLTAAVACAGADGPATRPAGPATKPAKPPPIKIRANPLEPDPDPQAEVVPRLSFVCAIQPGSPAGQVDVLKDELTKAVRTLKPTQEFSLVFPAGKGEAKPHTFPADGTPAKATPETLRAAYKFLNDYAAPAAGGPKAVDAVAPLKAALAGKPKLAFLLTNADVADPADLPKAVAGLNADAKAKINTIMFASKPRDVGDPTVDALERVAGDSGGNFRQVFVDVLKKKPK